METLIALIIVAGIAGLIIWHLRKNEKPPITRTPKKDTRDWKVFFETIRTAIRGLHEKESKRLFLIQQKDQIKKYLTDPDFRDALWSLLDQYGLEDTKSEFL